MAGLWPDLDHHDLTLGSVGGPNSESAGDFIKCPPSPPRLLSSWGVVVTNGPNNIFIGITFRLGGQIKFGTIYIHTQLNTTAYVGITTKNNPKQAKKLKLHTVFLPPPLAGIGKLLALFGQYFGIGITVQ